MHHFPAGFSLEELTQRLGDCTDDAIVVSEAEPVADPGPRIVYVNPAFTRMTGYSAEEVLGRSPRLLQGEGTSWQTRHRLRQAFNRWEAVRAELLNYRKDGSTFWVELNIVPVADDQGWYRYWVAVQRDVTERRLAEQQRQWQERLLHTLGDGILVADATQPGLPLEYVNDCALRITGYTRDDFLGRNCRFLQGPGSDPEAVRQLREGIQERRTVTTEILNYRKDGSTFLNLVTLSPMFGEHGELIKFIAVQRDITELRDREQQMVIAQRVKAVGELAGGIAHDFNNLLTSIMGASDLLAERVFHDPELAQLAASIRSAAQRGGAQVRRLMSLTRTPQLTRSAVDLQAVVNQLAQLLRRSLRENIHLHLEIDPAHAWVDAEPSQLESALLNLVLNAQDAMPRGGEVRIASTLRSEDGVAWVAISVVDQGSGMPPETVRRIFDPFFTTKEAGRGSGLGLAMVHAFVTQMGGRIGVQSKAGKGTRFTLCLRPAEPPRAASADGDDASREPLFVEGAGRPRSATGERPPVVLLVEDDAVVRITARAMLERLGYQVIEAQDGSQALDVLQTPAPVDLLFTDLLMPGGLNGRELCALAQAVRPGLRQLQTSGWADSILADVNGEAGPPDATHFINKPYTLQELARAVQDSLQH
ncbi:MAG: PAS domain-containing protein [Pseudomonadota bacterium]